MLQEYVRNVLAVSVLCCSACFHGGKLQVFYLMLHMFHIYVASVCSKWFIRFIRMLHLNISCCTCFILFGESVGVMVARHERRRMGRGDLEAGSGGATRAGYACRTRRAASNPGGQGESSGRACGVGIKISISARGQAARASCPDVRALA